MKSVLLAAALGLSAAAQAQISVPASTTQNPAPVPAGTGTVVINADLGRTTISRHIYGQFATHAPLVPAVRLQFADGHLADGHLADGHLADGHLADGTTVETRRDGAGQGVPLGRARQG